MMGIDDEKQRIFGTHLPAGRQGYSQIDKKIKKQQIKQTKTKG
ncbi:MAG: hypothetical protein PHX21_03315 [bacterium]|nr:hypothetical protein [bacterium]